ncbi:hypothetical protein H9Q69_007100 [Fusarium xylarioides]|nr:hypothetical protein H9Q69_007100 [Fusarium xylarioides]
MAESINFALMGDSVCSPDFANCNKDDLDFSHLARRVPAPAVPNKRKHIEKQVQLNKRSRTERPTTTVARPSRTVNTCEPRGRTTDEQAPAALPSQTAETRESRGRAALERVADQLRSAGHIVITPVILNILPSDRIYRLVWSFMSRATVTAFYDMALVWNLDTGRLICRATHAKARTSSERLFMIETLGHTKKLTTYLTRYHQMHLHLDRGQFEWHAPP